MQQEVALAGMCWSIETVSVVKKYGLTLIGKVSAPASRIQVIVSGKTRAFTNFGYIAKIGFASKRINGVEVKLMARKPQ